MTVNVASTANIVDYRMDRKGKVFGICFCGVEQQLTNQEIRELAQDKPEVIFKLGQSK